MNCLRGCMIAVAAGLLAFATPGLAGAGQRIALIIGNDDYEHLDKLEKAVADAKTYAGVLADTGFDRVILKTDLTRSGMDAAIAEFLDAIQSGDVAVFVYSGHGWSDGSQNYILGTDAPATGSEDYLARVSIALRNGVNGVLDDMHRKGAGFKAAIIDACRDNPFVQGNNDRGVGVSRGLARIDPPKGTFVVFSAGQGQTALDRLSDDDANPNSVFTRIFAPLLRDGHTLRDATVAAREEVVDIARMVDHEQLPAYYDEVLGNTCLAENCAGTKGPDDAGGGQGRRVLVREMDVPALCKQALDVVKTGWEVADAYRDYVGEVQLRGLSVDACRAALGMRSIEEQRIADLNARDVCQRALNPARDAWGDAGGVERYAHEARSRGLTVDACRVMLGLTSLRAKQLAEMSQADLCRQALNADKKGWNDGANGREFSKEARARSLTIDACRSTLGLKSLREQAISEMTRANLCQQALDGSRRGWEQASGDYAREARSRSYTIDQCRGALGMKTVAQEDEDLNPTARFTISNNTSERIGVAFFDGETRTRFDPAADRHYPMDGKTTRTFKIACTPGQKVCYGAWKGDGRLNPYWGLGFRGAETCTRCCLTCPATTGASYTFNDDDWRTPKPTLTWTIVNNTGRNLAAAFYSKTRSNYGWPDYNRNWPLKAGANTFTLNCRANEKICYGAWDNNNINGTYWGVGPFAKHGCDNCCQTCDGRSTTNTMVP